MKARKSYCNIRSILVLLSHIGGYSTVSTTTVRRLACRSQGRNQRRVAGRGGLIAHAAAATARTAGARGKRSCHSG